VADSAEETKTSSGAPAFMELASAFDPPEMTGAVGMPVSFEKPLKRNEVSVAYASAEYETKGPDVTKEVEVATLVSVVDAVVTAVDVTVVVAPVEVAYRNARTPTTIIRTTITAVAKPEKRLFHVFTIGSVM
jgi:hypothetical protein